MRENLTVYLIAAIAIIIFLLSVVCMIRELKKLKVKLHKEKNVEDTINTSNVPLYNDKNEVFVNSYILTKVEVFIREIIIKHWFESDYKINKSNCYTFEKYRDIFNFHKYVALFLYNNYTSIISKNEILKLYNKYLSNNDMNIEDIIGLNNTGLHIKSLLKPSQNNYIFVHEFISEYFIGYAAYELFIKSTKTTDKDVDRTYSSDILHMDLYNNLKHTEFEQRGHNIAKILFTQMVTEHINRLREEDKIIDFSFDKTNELSRVNLQELNLENIDLSGAILSGINLSGANLSESNLVGADLSYANLSGANLIWSDMEEANLSHANVVRANFYNVEATKNNNLGLVMPIQNSDDITKPFFEWRDFDREYKHKGIIYSEKSREYVIALGTYPQIIDEEKSPIYWYGVKDILLGKGDVEEVLLVSRQSLTYKSYNEGNIDTTWEKSTLRKWLNNDENGFISEAFENISIKNEIALSDVKASVNSYYIDTNQGRDIEDKIFLLSLEEIEKYMPSKKAKITIPTEYAIEHSVTNHKKEKAEWYWLRTLGRDRLHAVSVSDIGVLKKEGEIIFSDDIAVCPALWWVNL